MLQSSEKALAVVMRLDSTNPDLNPSKSAPGFGMGTPKFVTAPDVEDGVVNNSFVGSVDPYSNRLVELDGGDAPPPPPPDGAPPDHILQAAMSKSSIKTEEGYDEFGRLLDEDGNPYDFSDEEDNEDNEFFGKGTGK